VYVKILGRLICEKVLDQWLETLTFDNIRVNHHSLGIECTH